MKGRMNDAALAELIASLPYYSPPRDFNRKVLAALGIEARPDPAGRWLLWGERALGTMAACWLGMTLFSLLFLAAAHMRDIMPVLSNPGTLLPDLKFYALRAGFIAADILRFLGMAKALVIALAGRLNLLPYLALSTVVAGTVILAVSRHPAYSHSERR